MYYLIVGFVAGFLTRQVCQILIDWYQLSQDDHVDILSKGRREMLVREDMNNDRG